VPAPAPPCSLTTHPILKSILLSFKRTG
jgi:hypothetical protein